MAFFARLHAARSLDGSAIVATVREVADLDDGIGSPSWSCRRRRWRAESEATVFEAYRRWGIR